MLLSGASDAAVKLWSLKGGVLSNTPMAEFYDHENAIKSVDVESKGNFAAAGADDGTVLIWDIKSLSLCGSCCISSSGRYCMLIHM